MASKYSNGHVSKNHSYWRANLSYQEGGKQKKISKSTGIKCYPGNDNRNKARAEAFLREWREELIAEEKSKRPEGSDVPFYDYCDYVLGLKNVKAVTMSGYKTYMKRLLNSELGNRKLSEVSGDDILRWEQDYRKDGLSEGTIIHAHAFVSMVLRHAFAQGKIDRNPILSVRGPKHTFKPVNSLTPTMRAAVLKKMDASENYRLATSVRIALLSGMRRSEICALRWQDIDLENRVIHVSNSFTKDEGFKLDSPKDPCGGRVTRDIPIGGVLTRYLKEQKARQEDELAEFGAKWADAIFVTGNPLDGSFFNPEMLGRQWSMLSDAESWKGTQGKKVTFHDLRHTFATLVINQEVMDVMSLAKILGHRDASVTLNVYADALADSKRKCMDALDGTLMLEEEDERPRGRHMRKL